MAIVVAVAVIVWMASGTITSPGSNAAVSSARTTSVPGENGQADRNERAGITVAVQRSDARPVERVVSVSARTEPNRVVEIRGEVEGRVVAIEAERGAFVREGDVIARLDPREREARLAQAQAQLEQHRIQHSAAMELRGRDLLSEVQVAEARARLVASEAELMDIELELERTTITAPFDGVVQERPIEIGDLVRIGDSIAEIVDTDPIIVVGEVNEREVAELRTGGHGTAVLATGGRVEGTVRYVAPVADAGTRTFSVELAVPNTERRIRAGITASLDLATDDLYGHLLQPSLLTLDDEGTIGVKIVDSRRSVKFVPVEILRSTTEGIWVTGLPETADIIAVGQGFVLDGQVVDAVAADGVPGGAARL